LTPNARILTAPVASDSIYAQADYLELLALKAADRNSSFQDLVAVIRQGGSIEALDESSTPDRGSEFSQQLADSVMSELDARSRSCGEQYPFDVSDQYIQLKGEEWASSSYIFQLLLTRFGVAAGPRGLKAATIFEELAVHVTAEYLGGSSSDEVKSYHFGFPRRLTPSGFEAALNDLCLQLGEGAGAKTRPSLRNQKDAKLDLVVWRSFPDKRIGKLIVFGQCAAGDRYDGKETELVPHRFHHMYMRTPLVLEPLLFFFLPRCFDEEEWERLVLAKLVLFDRCRISTLSDRINVKPELNGRIARWNKHVLAGKVRG
jgi:hypothetical protein